MTDRELLEQIHAQLSAFIANTETNFNRVFNELGRIDKHIDNLDRRLDLVMEELVGVKIQTKSRLDRLEGRVEQLER